MAECTEINNYISAYIDDEIDPENKNKLDEHFEECEACRAEFEALRDIVSALNTVVEVELPADFHENAMNKIRDIATPIDIIKRKKSPPKITYHVNKISGKFISAAAGLIAAMFLLSAIGDVVLYNLDLDGDTSQHKETYGINKLSMDEADTYEAASDKLPTQATQYAARGSETAAALTDKARANNYFTKHYNITLEVDDIEEALSIINRLPGYNVNSSIGLGNYKTAYVSRSINSAEYQNSRNIIRNIGKVVQEQENGSWIADAVIDVQARISAKDEEVRRLQNMFKSSDSLSYMAAVEKYLSNAENERDSLKTQLINYDSQINNSMLTITLTSPTPNTRAFKRASYIQRLNIGFTRSANICIGLFEDLLIVASALIVPLSTVIILFSVVIVLLRERRNKSGK